ncbi:LysR substrate-binding domain-containing protein [Marinobacterium jannaschii]|uniref:LysR substrate-binding domain-containing protein n=1 Tax=Marinobacterium jannaschii TaxID=64970 RepID=UPI000488DE09|nr:LysR substrate-binding domain-containing protein [Marinobacterium jannaschii]
MAGSVDFRKLPPLKALKGFEAVARLLSVRRAAEELNLTHPAVSHQVQQLEQDLGVKLFARQGRNIVLTDEGERYYICVQGALEQLVLGSDAMRRQSQQPALRVQSYITFSVRWLAHRLTRFRSQYPHIELHLMTSGNGWEFDEAHADIGIIYHRGTLPEHLYWVKLFDSELFPVCSPSLLEGCEEPLTPQQLTGYPLLSVYTEEKHWNWQRWFSACGVTERQAITPVMVDTLVVALEMAINGEGIALVNGPLVNDDLASGRLVRPFDLAVEGEGSWGLVCRRELLQNPQVQTFIGWLQQQL